ncbi:MAG: metal ABC transporter permease [Defluviicoccus sp.]|nr:metal ABC transporter permease [Defluviicoccus sp.]
MLETFFIRAVIAGIGVALVAGPLGCFIVWRRMAYFGDAMAHSALLGVALGFLLDIEPSVGIIAVASLIALSLAALQRRGALAVDTLLGIFAHAALSLGLVVLGLMVWLRLDLMAYLFGDILAVTWAEIGWIYFGGACVLAVLTLIWRPLLAATVHADLAQAEGVPVAAAQTAFMLLIALIIALAIKLVGVLLITSLLIIPAAAARRFARTPEQMAVGASLIGAAAVVAGLLISLNWDIASGPAIVVAASAAFAASLLVAPKNAR